MSRGVRGVESDAAEDDAAERRDSTQRAVDCDVNAVRGEGGDSADARVGTATVGECRVVSVHRMPWWMRLVNDWRGGRGSWC